MRFVAGGAPWRSCWPGRREDWPGAEVELLARAGAGRGAAAERHLEDAGRGAAAERHLEDDGRGAAAERHLEDDGRGAVAKRLAGRRGEEPSGSNCGRKCQCGSIGKRLLAGPMWKSKAASAEEQRRPVRPADGKCLVRRLPPAGIRIRRRFLPGS